jgi:hypothetical protein
VTAGPAAIGRSRPASTAIGQWPAPCVAGAPRPGHGSVHLLGKLDVLRVECSPVQARVRYRVDRLVQGLPAVPDFARKPPRGRFEEIFEEIKGPAGLTGLFPLGGVRIRESVHEASLQ